MNKIMNEIIETGEKLYYIINPTSKMDVPSYFYEKVEKEYKKWIQSSDYKTISFYDYCLKNNKIKL